MEQDNPKTVVAAWSERGRPPDNLIAYAKKQKTFFVSGVIASATSCLAIEVAVKERLLFFVGDFADNTKITETLPVFLAQTKLQLIVLAGFLKKFPINVLQLKEYKNRVINIYPSLLPQFCGQGK